MYRGFSEHRTFRRQLLDLVTGKVYGLDKKADERTLRARKFLESKLDAGATTRALYEDLIRQGFTPDEAASHVAFVVDHRRARWEDARLQRMLGYGALFAICLLFSIDTLRDDDPSWRILVGGIAVGAIGFFRQLIDNYEGE